MEDMRQEILEKKYSGITGINTGICCVPFYNGGLDSLIAPPVLICHTDLNAFITLMNKWKTTTCIIEAVTSNQLAHLQNICPDYLSRLAAASHIVSC